MPGLDERPIPLATYRHQPDSYDCPFCLVQRGVFTEHNQLGDVVAVTELAFACISPQWWPANPGAALVVPRGHHENIYDFPAAAGHAVWDLVQQVALAMRTTYVCEGISIRQHNEPAGDQDVWHLHVHVFPRHRGDGLYERHNKARWVASEERAGYADVLASQLNLQRTFGVERPAHIFAVPGDSAGDSAGRAGWLVRGSSRPMASTSECPRRAAR